MVIREAIEHQIHHEAAPIVPTKTLRKRVINRRIGHREGYIIQQRQFAWRNNHAGKTDAEHDAELIGRKLTAVRKRLPGEAKTLEK